MASNLEGLDCDCSIRSCLKDKQKSMLTTVITGATNSLFVLAYYHKIMASLQSEL